MEEYQDKDFYSHAPSLKMDTKSSNAGTSSLDNQTIPIGFLLFSMEEHEKGIFGHAQNMTT